MRFLRFVRDLFCTNWREYDKAISNRREGWHGGGQ